MSYMSLHDTPPREALSAMTLFFRDCSLDRTGESLPLRELVDSVDVEDFHFALEDLLRGLLVEYSLEQRSRMIKEGLRRTAQREFLH